MPNQKHVTAGKLGLGVKRKFSPEEIERRKSRLAAIRHLGPQAMIRKAEQRRRSKTENEALVRTRAEQGLFTPLMANTKPLCNSAISSQETQSDGLNRQTRSKDVD